MALKSSCCKLETIDKRSNKKFNSTTSFIAALLVILLPKCPFCIAAYAGAAMLFFGVESSQLAPYLMHAKPILGLTILTLILMNNKGRKTAIAGVTVAIALILLLLSVYLNIEILPLWIIYTIFVLSIWFNGNFEYFFRFIGSKAR